MKVYGQLEATHDVVNGVGSYQVKGTSLTGRTFTVAVVGTNDARTPYRTQRVPNDTYFSGHKEFDAAVRSANTRVKKYLYLTRTNIDGRLVQS